MRLTAIVGSCRKGVVIDTAVDEILASTREQGAEVVKIHLIDQDIQFCTNCLACTQQPKPERGKCIIEDDMNGVIKEIERSDGIVLASPMNFGTVRWML